MRRDPGFARLPSSHAPAVVELLHVRADRPQPGNHGRDPVRLLDPQLGGVAHLGVVVGRCHRDRQQRQLVDQVGDLAAIDRYRAQRPAAADRHLADRLRAAHAGDAGLDLGAHPLEEPDQRQPGRVQAHPGHRQLRVGMEGGGHQPGRCRRRVAGHLQLERLRLRRTGHGRHAALAVDRHTHERQHPLGVVAGRPGVSIMVSPVALSPARAAAPRTWALATGR